jgi:hypothetical protein
MKKGDEEEMSWIPCKFGFEFEWWTSLASLFSRAGNMGEMECTVN